MVACLWYMCWESTLKSIRHKVRLQSTSAQGPYTFFGFSLRSYVSSSYLHFVLLVRRARAWESLVLHSLLYSSAPHRRWQVQFCEHRHTQKKKETDGISSNLREWGENSRWFNSCCGGGGAGDIRCLGQDGAGISLTHGHDHTRGIYTIELTCRDGNQTGPQAQRERERS